MNIYYVYIYRHPITYTPFYVGYGKNDRHLAHLNEAKLNPTPKRYEYKLNTIRKILRDGLEPVIQIVDSNLSKEQACELEIFLISEIGRLSENGPLTNITPGGNGGDTISKNPNKQQFLIRQNETRIKNGKLSWTDGHIQIYSRESPGDGFYRGYPDYRLKKLAESGKIGAEKNSKKIWVNNGDINIMVLPNEIPKGYTRGRLGVFSNGRKSPKGTRWYNDGVKSYMLLPDDPQTNTLMRGRLKGR